MPSFDSLQAYLKHTGVLSWGTPYEIAAHKKEYRRAYHRHWRKKRRKERPEVTVSFSQTEYRRLRSNAKRHDLSLPLFLRETTFAYLDQTILIPNRDNVDLIIQHLRLWQTELYRVSDHSKAKSFEEFYSTYRFLAQKVRGMEDHITQTFVRQPYDRQESDQ